jgi:hypothetical protein
MAGVFKNLDASDVRLTPFQTHKKWNDTICYTNYYSNVLAHPTVVGGLPAGGFTEYAFAIDVSGSRVLRLLPTQEYVITGSVTIPGLLGAKYGASIAQDRVVAYSVTGSNTGSVYMIRGNLTNPPQYTSSVVTKPYDVSHTRTLVGGQSLIYVAGEGGISAQTFVSTFGTSEQVITGLGDPSLTSSFYAINAEGKSSNSDRLIAVSVTGSNAYAVSFSGNFSTNTLVAAGSSSLGSTPGVLPKTLLYNYDQDLYFLLMQDGQLYTVQPNGSSSLLDTGVADILQNRANRAANSSTLRSTKIHVVYQSGQIGLDIKATPLPASFEKIVDARQYVAQRPIVKGTIQINDPSGSIGLFAGSTSSLQDSIFVTINPYTYEISNPIHMGATKGDLRISGENLDAFVGFSSSYNNRFVQFDVDNSIFQQYKADYNPQPSHPSYDPLNTLFDEGNPTYQYYEPKTTNDKFQRVVHKSIDHLFYQYFYSNTKATFGGGNINTQHRFLEDQAQIYNLPQTKFGESIQQGSITVQGNYTISQSNTSVTIIDDLYGNLYVSGGFVSPIDGTTIVSGSISSSVVGEWPTPDIYKYNTKGPLSFTSSFNKGDWQMESNYSNVNFTTITGSSAPLAQPIDLLGVVPVFASTLSSSITIKPGPVQEYKQAYNFENGDFTITAMIRPSAVPTNSTGSVIVVKEGSEEETGIDINGNPYTYFIDNRTPYHIYINPSMEVVFERNNLLEQPKVSGSVTINQLQHITAMKTGSEMRLYVDGVLQGTIADVGVNRGCSNRGSIIIGNSFTKDRGFDGLIDNIKFYKRALTPSEVLLSRHTLGYNDTVVGNVFYTQGMMVLSSVGSRFMDITNITVRGTHTIWEKEYSCTVGAGEFNRSNNPSLQVYNSNTNQYEFRSFTTGSDFKPYVTSVGLYDDRGRLLAVAKLSSPLKLPSNVDTTIIVKLDS